MTDAQKAKDCRVEEGGSHAGGFGSGKSTISPPLLDSAHKSTSAQEPKREGRRRETPATEEPGGRGEDGDEGYGYSQVISWSADRCHGKGRYAAAKGGLRIAIQEGFREGLQGAERKGDPAATWGCHGAGSCRG